jgi:hypothetical protein
MHSLHYGGTLTFKTITIDKWCSVDVTARLAHKLMKKSLIYLKERMGRGGRGNYIYIYMIQVVSVGYGE